MRRSRPIYAFAVAVTIVLGLASRHFAAELPAWLAKNAGDSLYATMIFFAFGFVRPDARTSRVAIAAIAFCFAIEFSQCYRAPWLDAIRATTPGHLVLGQGFHVLDLGYYLVGVAVASLIEMIASRYGRIHI